MVKMLLRQILTLAVIFLLACRINVAQTQPPKVEPAFSLSITAEPAAATINDPLKIRIRITNVSDHPIVISQDRGGPNLNNFGVSVRDESNNEPPKTEFYHALRGEPTETPRVILSNDFPVLIDPGKSKDNVIDLSDFYLLTRPGKYTVQISWFDKLSKSNVKSNTVTISITPQR